MKPPYVIVLARLQQGRELLMKNGLMVGMDEDNHLCHKMTRTVNGKNPQDEWFKLDVPFNVFADWCSLFSSDELFLLGAETALQSIKS